MAILTHAHETRAREHMQRPMKVGFCIYLRCRTIAKFIVATKIAI